MSFTSLLCPSLSRNSARTNFFLAKVFARVADLFPAGTGGGNRVTAARVPSPLKPHHLTQHWWRMRFGLGTCVGDGLGAEIGLGVEAGLGVCVVLGGEVGLVVEVWLGVGAGLGVEVGLGLSLVLFLG